MSADRAYRREGTTTPGHVLPIEETAARWLVELMPGPDGRRVLVALAELHARRPFLADEVLRVAGRAYR